MPDRPQSTPTPNLNSDTEHTRRELYDIVVQMQFSPVEDAKDGEWTGPTYSADECGLKVFYILSRWFATWTNLGEPHLPPDQMQELVRINPDPDSRFGIVFQEV
jgi:hypothetical protein